jgi:hypothetical protein
MAISIVAWLAVLLFKNFLDMKVQTVRGDQPGNEQFVPPSTNNAPG